MQLTIYIDEPVTEYTAYDGDGHEATGATRRDAVNALLDQLEGGGGGGGEAPAEGPPAGQQGPRRPAPSRPAKPNPQHGAHPAPTPQRR